jgi:hypothetical protein
MPHPYSMDDVSEDIIVIAAGASLLRCRPECYKINQAIDIY